MHNGTSNGMSDAFVFFGATGDLAYKQIFPSLQNLIRDQGMNIPIIGVAKAGWNLNQLKERAKDSLEHHGGLDQVAWEKMEKLLRYVDGDYGDPATFIELRKQLGKAQSPLHYLAVPPSLFGTVALGLQKAGCSNNSRAVIEKPFGHNLETALELNRALHKVFPESAIYRIDHYLGKEPVQNIIYTRFANPIFEPIWNRDHIRSIQLTMAETYSVTDRGKFYDETGALRDVVQNHMLQVLANLTMDPPTGEDYEADRDSKAALLKAVRPLTPNDIVRGQYNGYRDVPGVAPGSTVETFVAIRCFIDSWRWAGVPIYIRAGKVLPMTCMEAVIEFKRPPRETYHELVPLRSSHVRFRISPDICIGMGVRVKVPGERMAGQDVELMLKSHAAHEMPPYERLLGDAMHGHGELFARQDLVEAQWRVVQPVLDNVTPVYGYEPGSWGPDEIAQLIGPDGPWIDPKPAQDEARSQTAGH